MRKDILFGMCLGLVAAFLLVDLFGITLLRNHNSLVRTIPVEDLRLVRTSFRHNPTDLKPLIETISGKNPEDILESLLNFVNKSENYSSPDPLKVFQYVKNGGGLGCGGLSTLFAGALAENDIPFRQVSIQRNYYDSNNTHMAVEVWTDGKWVLFDPSLNIKYEIDGEWAGAQDISDALHAGRSAEITPRFFGAAAYPVTITKKDEKWFAFLTMFDNVYIMENENPGLIEKIPPFRYWLGPRLYYEKKSGIEGETDKQAVHENIYFTLIVVLPAAILLFLLTALGIRFRSR